MRYAIVAFVAFMLVFSAAHAALNVKNIDIDALTSQIEKLLNEQYGNMTTIGTQVTGINISGLNVSALNATGGVSGGVVQGGVIPANNTTGQGASQQGSYQIPGQQLLGQDLKKQIINVIIIASILCYIFAAGKIADFLQSGGKEITKKEALVAPFAYFAASAFAILFYFSSGLYAPPQATPVTLGFYLILIPALITLGAGTIVLYSFFHDRLNPASCFSLSIRIIGAPIFDGIKGYWTALGAAVIVGGVSTISFFSSGGNMALATTDFLYLSITVSLYFIYKAAVALSNEDRASSLTTLLFILSPSIIRVFARDIACAIIGAIPIRLFSACPLAADQQTSLALSLAATFIVLLPLIPIAYAALVNSLRAISVLKLLAAKERAQAGAGKPAKE
ncbi:MAG: hypothetical protein WC506_01890 [Candidatus Micrarchaeia archaeon]